MPLAQRAYIFIARYDLLFLTYLEALAVCLDPTPESWPPPIHPTQTVPRTLTYGTLFLDSRAIESGCHLFTPNTMRADRWGAGAHAVGRALLSI